MQDKTNLPCPNARLLEAIKASNEDEVFRLLVDEQASPDACHEDTGTTALIMAIEHGNADIVEMLLDSGANPFMPDDWENTPLMLAVADNQIDIVMMLLDHEANMHEVTYEGLTALDVAAQEGLEELHEAMTQHWGYSWWLHKWQNLTRFFR